MKYNVIIDFGFEDRENIKYDLEKYDIGMQGSLVEAIIRLREVQQISHSIPKSATITWDRIKEEDIWDRLVRCVRQSNLLSGHKKGGMIILGTKEMKEFKNHPIIARTIKGKTEDEFIVLGKRIVPDYDSTSRMTFVEREYSINQEVKNKMKGEAIRAMWLDEYNS